DGDDQALQAMTPHGIAEGLQRPLEADLGVLDHGRRHEDPAVEVGQHPFGAGLGAINADDAEVLRPHGLNPGMEGAPGFVDQVGVSPTASLRPGRSGHAKGPPKGGLEWFQFPHWKSAWRYGLEQFPRILPHTRGLSTKGTGPTGGSIGHPQPSINSRPP